VTALEQQKKVDASQVSACVAQRKADQSITSKVKSRLGPFGVQIRRVRPKGCAAWRDEASETRRDVSDPWLQVSGSTLLVRCEIHSRFLLA
jgi:hypothetical protein